jgi:hypothetical protein
LAGGLESEGGIEMRLTWRDGVTTLLMALVVAVALAVTQRGDWPLLGSYRSGVGVLGVVGITMCSIGSSLEASSFRSPLVRFASVLGGVAVVLIVAGLIAGTETLFLTLAADIAVLWVVATLRHALEGRPEGAPGHPVAAR